MYATTLLISRIAASLKCAKGRHAALSNRRRRQGQGLGVVERDLLPRAQLRRRLEVPFHCGMDTRVSGNSEQTCSVVPGSIVAVVNKRYAHRNHFPQPLGNGPRRVHDGLVEVQVRGKDVRSQAVNLQDVGDRPRRFRHLVVGVSFAMRPSLGWKSTEKDAVGDSGLRLAGGPWRVEPGQREKAFRCWPSDRGLSGGSSGFTELRSFVLRGRRPADKSCLEREFSCPATRRCG